MATVKHLYILLTITLLSITTGCKKESSLEWDMDVYTKIRKSGNDTLYALSAYAYAYQEMSDVTLTIPGYNDKDGNYIVPKESNMTKFIGLNKSWILPTSNSDYTKIYPVIGEYSIVATNTNDGAKYSKTNNLSRFIVLPSKFVSLTYNQTENKYILSWNWMSGATNYRIYLYKGEELVAQSSLTREPTGSITLTDGKGYNDISIATGDNISFEVVGNVYESSTSSKIKSQASMVYDIKWGDSYKAPEESAASSSASASNAE